MNCRTTNPVISMPKNVVIRIILAAAVQACSAAFSAAEVSHTNWVTQFGTYSYDTGYDVSADQSDNIYLSGYTAAAPEGLTSLGNGDAYLSKHDADGNLLWTVRHGTDKYDQGNSLAATRSGSLYVTGFTLGDLAGANQGSADGFLSKFDTSGNLKWNQQFGSALRDEATAVAVDGQHSAYVAGTSGDEFSENPPSSYAFIRKFDADGAQLWMDQFGQRGLNRATSISSDGLGGVYVSGTFSALYAGDTANAYLRKYGGDGELLWSKTLGTTQYNANVEVSADALGNVFVAGGINGALLIKYDANGALQWTVNAPPGHQEASIDIAADGFGNAYVTGIIWDNEEGYSNMYDVLVSKYGSNRTFLWSERLSTPRHDVGYGVGVDSRGRAIVTGYTEGDLAVANIGAGDFFLAKLGDGVPEPSALHTIIAGAAAFFATPGARRNRRGE